MSAEAEFAMELVLRPPVNAFVPTPLAVVGGSAVLQECLSTHLAWLGDAHESEMQMAPG
jgi:hypothetical protein